MAKVLRALRTGLVLVLILLLVGLGWVGLRFAKGAAAAGIYQQRLEALHGDYEQLRGQYNQAVRRTAVTELVVEDDVVTVVVREADGSTREVRTPLSGSEEVFVDYVVLDGRLMIRRVFDSYGPAQGVVIDPELLAVDFSAYDAAVGKAVYRTLGEGRWIVSVTGDGSLGLTEAPDEAPAELAYRPEVRDYDPLEEADAAAQDAGRDISVMDVMRALWPSGV
jgi:hypothetical protein